MDTRLKSKKTMQQTEVHEDETEQCGSDSQANASITSGATQMPPPRREMTDLDLILRELRDFRRDNKEQLDDIKEEIMRTNTRLDEAEERILKAEERVQNTEDVLTEMLKLHVKLDAKITEQESRSRRENIRIYGVPEEAEKESPTMISFVEKLLRENLNIDDATTLEIERAHRALGPRPPQDAQPRSILAKFLSFKTKEMILRLAWQKKGFTWQGRQINLDNDYAPQILQKRREYKEVRKVLKERQIPFQTLYPARLRVKYDGETRVYETVEDATQDLVRRGFPLETIKPPETLMEQLQRLTWERSGRRAGGRTPRTGREANFREKLQAFRRSPNATT